MINEQFSTPELHIPLIGKRCGILGDPKTLYDTMLNLNEPLLRLMPFNEDYDPYNFVNRVSLNIPTEERFKKRLVLSRHFLQKVTNLIFTQRKKVCSKNRSSTRKV